MNNKFLKTIDYAILKFCDSLGFNKPYFFQFLTCSDKQAPKFLNPNDEQKQLKVIDLLAILDNLDDEHRKIILDNLCQKYNFQCLSTSPGVKTSQNLEHILLNITSTNGDLSKEFLLSIQDNNIDKQEKEKLNKIAYDLRSLLRTFENRINKESSND